MKLVLFCLSLGCQRAATSYTVDVPPPTGSAPVLPMASTRPHPVASSSPLPNDFRTGDAVEVEYHGDWWPAHVLEVGTATYHIHYDGYADDWDEEVGLDRIRARSE